MRLALLLFTWGVFFALSSQAQTPTGTSQLSHDEVIARVTGLIYVRNMTARCALPKNIADTFEIVAMVLGSSIPKISQEETSAAAKNAEASADHNIETSKEKACKEAQQIIETTANAMSKLQKRSAPATPDSANLP